MNRLTGLLAAAAAATGVAFAIAGAMPRRDAPAGIFTPTGCTRIAQDSIVRISGVLRGMPHTSGRIDSCMLAGDGIPPEKALDIDGVDFGRYFQWEDEGEIELEIDFRMPREGEEPAFSRIMIFTPRGVMESAIEKPTAEK